MVLVSGFYWRWW